MNKYKNVYLANHPLCAHNLSIIRDKNTNSELFANSVKRIAYLLFYMASEDFELDDIETETPLEICKAKCLNRKKEIITVPILRAGLIFSDVAAQIMPFAQVRHIGMYRDEETLKPVMYYNKIPLEFESPEDKIILILDPMLATGSTAAAAVKLFTDKKIPQKNIKFISLISAPEGIEKLQSCCADVKIITACIDDSLNKSGYILPGLGDAGDRIFNTTGD